MAIRRDEAFILKRVPFRETSLIVTVFGRESGKLKVLVKGVRKEKSPLIARFEPFTHISLVYYEKSKSDIHLGTEAVVLSTNSFLRERLDCFSYASYMTELVDVFFGAHDAHPEVFDLLAKAFLLFRNAQAKRVARVFEFKLLDEAGLMPILTHCASCGIEPVDEPFFSSKQGGIICKRCDRDALGAIPISKASVQNLLISIKSPMEQAVAVPLGAQIEGELERIGDRFLKFRLEYPLRSSHFLTELKPFLKSSVST